MINFPNPPTSPVDHSVIPWVDAGGNLWIYDTLKQRWSRAEVQPTFVQDAPEPVPYKPGQFWFAPSTGTLKCASADLVWLSAGGGGGASLTRFAASGNQVYCGKAPAGSADSDAVWLITRITTAGDGSITTATAEDVAWDDYATATYT